MRHRQRRGGGGEVCQCVQRNRLPLGRSHINLAQELRVLPKFRRSLHDDVILIQRRVHGGYLPLSERVVQSVVDQLRRNTEARRGGPVILHHSLKAPVLLVAAHVGDGGNAAQLLQHSRRVVGQVL